MMKGRNIGSRPGLVFDEFVQVGEVLFLRSHSLYERAHEVEMVRRLFGKGSLIVLGEWAHEGAIVESK
jgi:hypothetical protein